MNKNKVLKLIDLHIEEKAGVPSNRELLWETLGEWQLESLKRIGLKPKSTLLDVGCGPLRFGSYAIPFLNEGNYYGVEVWEPYLSLGKRVLEEFNITKKYTMVIDTEFNYQSLNQKFDFAIAQSVVTHLSTTQLKELMRSLKEVMNKGGMFLFTYSNNNFPYSVFYEMRHPMITPSNLTNDYFESLAYEFGVNFHHHVSNIESHPTSQDVAYFQF